MTPAGRARFAATAAAVGLERTRFIVVSGKTESLLSVMAQSAATIFAQVLAAATRNAWREALTQWETLNEMQDHVEVGRGDMAALLALARKSRSKPAKTLLAALEGSIQEKTLAPELLRHSRLMMQHKTRQEEFYFVPTGQGDLTLQEALDAYRVLRPDIPAMSDEYYLRLVVLHRGVLGPYQSFEAYVGMHGLPEEDE
jgi:hypothetical protein